jgi:beta-glucosidase
MNEDTRIRTLLSRMTLAEKIGQLCQIHDGRPENEAIVRAGQAGSMINVGDVERINEFQRIAVEETRLGIPLLVGRDVIHGFRTIFPIPLGQSASWDPPLVEEAAAAAAREAAANGIRWTFSPMVDIARDPRWGRIAEGCGEDAYLTGLLGAAMVRGYQGKDLADPERVAACAKHFVGYGAAEGGRDYNTADLSEPTLRDVHLGPFAACVQAGVATVMSAFNEINGVPASGNAHTLRRILRQEWGFEGMVVSDWESVREMIVHGYCADKREAALAALEAGVDMEMVSACYLENLEKLVREGKLELRRVNEAVANVLRLKHRLGLFERWRTNASRRSALLSAGHLDTARQLASESLVLLKNDGALPLGGGRRLAVIGPLADQGADQLGCWVFDGRPGDTRTPLQALRELAPVEYAPGMAEPMDVGEGGFPEARKAAASSDAVVLFLGEPAKLSGEAHCRTCLGLPGAQRGLFEAVAAAGKPVVVVLMAGRPLAAPWLFERANAVLMAWHPGTMGGPAIADALMGKACPSGKLTVSWPRAVGQVPVHYNHKNTGRPAVAADSLAPQGTALDPFDFRSGYLDLDHRPQFPFGFGLSYTAFAYGDVKVSPKRVKLGGRFRVTARLRNSGKVAGEEVAQLYVRDLVGSLTRPVKELKGFQRVSLAPGEGRTVTFVLHTRDLAFTNAKLKRVTERGEFQAWVAGDSDGGTPVTFSVV